MMSASALRGSGGAAADVYSSNKDSEGYAGPDEELGATAPTDRSNANVQKRLLDKFKAFSGNGGSGYGKKKLFTSSNIIMTILGLMILMMFIYFLAAVSFVGSTESPDLAAEHSRNPTMQRNPPSIGSRLSSSQASSLSSKEGKEESNSADKEKDGDSKAPKIRGASDPEKANKAGSGTNRQIYKPGAKSQSNGEKEQDWDPSMKKGSVSDKKASPEDTATSQRQEATGNDANAGDPSEASSANTDGSRSNSGQQLPAGDRSQQLPKDETKTDSKNSDTTNGKAGLESTSTTDQERKPEDPPADSKQQLRSGDQRQELSKDEIETGSKKSGTEKAEQRSNQESTSTADQERKAEVQPQQVAEKHTEGTKSNEKETNTEKSESIRRLLAVASSKYSSHAVGRLPKLSEDKEATKAVSSGFWHAWNGYKQFAYGKDTLKPVSRRGDDSFLGMGITILDSLDTMLVMGYVEEFWNHVSWLLDNMHFAKQRGVNLFESTIRVLGGIISAYDWSDDDNLERLLPNGLPQSSLSAENRQRTRSGLLKKAEELANALLPCFNSDTGLPYSTVDLGTGKASSPAGSSTTSEVGTIQLEWERLTSLTAKEKYGKLTRQAMDKLTEIEPSDGLWPIWVDPNSGKFTTRTVTLGARGDSIYEYILKQWVVQGGLDRRRAAVWKDSFSPPSGAPAEDEHMLKLRQMYDRSVSSISSQLVKRTTGKPSLTYIGERIGSSVNNKMDHLVCFTGGMLALGAPSAWGLTLLEAESALEILNKQTELSTETSLHKQDLEQMILAHQLTETCVHAYTMNPTGLASEIFRFSDTDMSVDSGSKHCLLRPETVESLYVLYRVSGEERYREAGWKIFQSLEKNAKIESGGYSSLIDVTDATAPKRDHQESFFLAETLKYLYLLFTDSSVLPLDEAVFNTEAHPFPLEKQ